MLRLPFNTIRLLTVSNPSQLPLLPRWVVHSVVGFQSCSRKSYLLLLPHLCACICACACVSECVRACECGCGWVCMCECVCVLHEFVRICADVIIRACVCACALVLVLVLGCLHYVFFSHHVQSQWQQQKLG
jgi:hypothetical protein